MPRLPRRSRTGQIVPQDLERAVASGDALPERYESRPGESITAWAERIKGDLVRETLLDSLRYRGEAFGHHYRRLVLDRVSPARQELDITARQDDWMRNLSTEELLQLQEIRQRAMARGPRDVVVDAVPTGQTDHDNTAKAIDTDSCNDSPV